MLCLTIKRNYGSLNMRGICQHSLGISCVQQQFPQFWHFQWEEASHVKNLSPSLAIYLSLSLLDFMNTTSKYPKALDNFHSASPLMTEKSKRLSVQASGSWQIYSGWPHKLWEGLSRWFPSKKRGIPQMSHNLMCMNSQPLSLSSLVRKLTHHWDDWIPTSGTSPMTSSSLCSWSLLPSYPQNSSDSRANSCRMAAGRVSGPPRGARYDPRLTRYQSSRQTGCTGTTPSGRRQQARARRQCHRWGRGPRSSGGSACWRRLSCWSNHIQSLSAICHGSFGDLPSLIGWE